MAQDRQCRSPDRRRRAFPDLALSISPLIAAETDGTAISIHSPKPLLALLTPMLTDGYCTSPKSIAARCIADGHALRIRDRDRDLLVYHLGLIPAVKSG